jgi:hypothetical protein
VDDARLLAALEEALAALDVPVRTEALPEAGRSRGGLVVVRGKPMVLVAAAASRAERVAVLARALAGLDTDALFLAPAVRERIEREKERSG